MVMVGTIKVPRVVVLIAVFMAGVLITAAVMWRLRTEPSAGIGSGTGGCGDVQVAGKDWLGGQGVDVRSNGAYQTKSTSCAYDDREVYDLKANPPIYGFGWQCVELVNRLYATKGWFPRLWLGPETGSRAKDMYDYAVSGKYAGLSAHANGSGYKPVPGDMIVHSNGDFGHVAVIDRIEGTTLHAVEQNNSPTGRATYTYDTATGSVSRPGATISGFIHAAKNTNSPNAAGPGGSGPTSTATYMDPGPLSFKITGFCTTVGGTLTAVSSNFTPGGEVSIAAWYPDGKPYTNLRSTATVRADGSTPWSWPCQGDPPGTYGTIVVDLSTGRTTGNVYFTINPAPAAKQSPAPPIVQPPPPPPPPPPPVEPKPVASNLRVFIYGGGHVGMAFDVAWQTARDPITCHFFIDGQERFTAQCGTYSSNQFYGISPGQHSFYATVNDRFGVYSDPTPTIVRNVT